MHHWTVHAKVEFHKFPPDVRSRVESIPQLLNLNSVMNLKNFPIMGGVHSITFHPELRNKFKIFPILGVHSTTFDPELRNERFILISFMGFPAILSTLQPFHICIFNRKNSKLTFSNDP